MKVENVKCPNCGANLEYDSWGRKYTCAYCKTVYKAKNEGKGVFDKVNPPQISMEDLEKFVTPLEDFADDVGKGLKKLLKIGLSVFMTMVVVGLVLFFALM